MTVMSKQQANAIVAQLDEQEQMETALNTFIAEGGDTVGPYLGGDTGYANAKKMTEWGLPNLGRQPLTTVSGWEICFNNTKAFLVADPAWRPKAKIYADLDIRLTADQTKKLYLGEQVALPADLAADLEKIGGPAGYRKFMDGEV